MPRYEVTAPAAVRERPIPFTADQVCATLAGTMTQTHRVMIPQPPAWITEFGHTAFTPPGHISGRGYWKGVPGEEGPGEKFFAEPYVVGMRLWVRETWNVANIGWEVPPDPPQPFADIRYRADGAIVEQIRCPEAFYWPEESRGDDAKWRPSIFMPRWASRLTLEITDVRVQRLQDISEADCCAEGVTDSREMAGLGYHAGNRCWWSLEAGHPITGVGAQCLRGIRARYAERWDARNAKRGFGYDTNPWVWALAFTRVEPST